MAKFEDVKHENTTGEFCNGTIIIAKMPGSVMVARVTLKTSCRACKTLYTLLFQHETNFRHFPKMP